MTINFYLHKMHDLDLAQTVENSFRAYGNFAGIHDFNFDNLYTLGSENWSAGSVDDTISSSSASLNATGLGAGWYMVEQTGIALPSSVLVRYHKTQNRQGVFIAKSGTTSYLVATDNSGYPIIQRFVSGTPTTVFSLPKATPVEADVEIAYRQIRFSDSQSDLWQTFSMYMNGALICTHVEKLANVLATPIHFGLAVYGGDTATYTNLSIPQITEFAETSTIDPSEDAMGGLQRAIEGRYLKFFMRWDGSLRAWRPRTTTSKHTYTDSDMLERNTSFDKRDLYTHVRQVGAYAQAEFIRRDLFPELGHRFTEVNNPYLLSESECFEQAELEILRMESNANTESFGCPLTPLVENEDRITTPTGDWIMTSRSIEVSRSKVSQQASTRLYTNVGA